MTISAFTPPGVAVVAVRAGCGIELGKLYTVRGFVLNRHWRTREPDPHVLFEEVAMPMGEFGEVGFPRDGFEIPSLMPSEHLLEPVAA